MGKRNIFKNMSLRQYINNIRRRWTIPSIKYDRGFKKYNFTKGKYRYRIRKYTIPRSVNGGRLFIKLLQGYRRYYK